jgi:hypothetical protein
VMYLHVDIATTANRQTRLWHDREKAKARQSGLAVTGRLIIYGA